MEQIWITSRIFIIFWNNVLALKIITNTHSVKLSTQYILLTLQNCELNIYLFSPTDVLGGYFGIIS